MFSFDSRSITIPSKSKALFHELLDYNMIRHGDKPIFTFALPDQKKVTDITFFEFGRAAHRVARYMRPDPWSGKDNEVVAILANISTPSYHAITMGVVRSGLTVCIPITITYRKEFHLFICFFYVAIPYVSSQLCSSSHQYVAEDGLSSPLDYAQER
jgi:acyl-CoA synthetase (AMP-forming)/AMP-acid ligase II